MILSAKFCSQCGHPAVGKYCVECGAKLVAPEEGSTPSPHEQKLIEEVVTNWQEEHRYDVLIKVPEVREMIQFQTNTAVVGMTGEELMSIFDKVIGHGVPMAKLAKVIQPLYASWGIHTHKERKEYVNAPIGRVMVRLLCSLAHFGQKIKSVQQADDGCCIHAVLLSDVWALEGDLIVTVSKHNRGANVTAVTHIGGSYFDWGKSKASLERLFKHLQTDPSCWTK